LHNEFFFYNRSIMPAFAKQQWQRTKVGGWQSEGKGLSSIEITLSRVMTEKVERPKRYFGE